MDRVDRSVAQLGSRMTDLESKLGTATVDGSPGASIMINDPSQELESNASPLYASQSAASDSDYRMRPSRELEPPVYSLTVPHRVILWPSVRQLLSDCGWAMTHDLERLSRQGTAWFLKRERAKHPQSLPRDDGSTAPPSLVEPGGIVFEVGESPPLSLAKAYEYTDMYFQTFNLVLPILEHDAFVSVLERLSREGYRDQDPEAVLALLVFALGKLATEGVFGEPINTFSGFPSGFRGGNAEYPPGLLLFNQARRRLGFVHSLCTLETAQIALLEGTYYEATAHHLEFWKSTIGASMGVQVLIKSRDFDWASHAGDMISRAYWACLMQEDLYHLELDLPQSGILQLEDDVPLPSFRPSSGHDGIPRYKDEGPSHFQHHFVAMIALRRLISRIHTAVHEPLNIRAESTDYRGAPLMIIHEMSRQLESWRSLLPKPLQWQDEEILQTPVLFGARKPPDEPCFVEQQDHSSVSEGNNLDILTAQLRTRFYYARYLLNRPFIYKALHFPELMGASDADSCALAINSMCLWPFFMAPSRSKKRLVPHLFAWTQHIIGILLIIKLIRRNDTLRWICENKVEPGRITGTSALMLDWIEDAKQVDGVADWSWGMLNFLFRVNLN